MINKKGSHAGSVSNAWRRKVLSFLGRHLIQFELKREARQLERRRADFEDEWLASAADLHANDRCFIIATGPSLNDLDLSRLKGEVLFGVNGTYMLDNIDLTYFVYVSNWWHKQHGDGIRSVRCDRRFLPSDYQEELDAATPTSWYRRLNPRYGSRFGVAQPVPRGFSRFPANYLYAGGTVVFVCLQLAHYLGFREVIIIGLDHSYSKSQDHKFREGPGYLSVQGKDKSHFADNYFKSGTEAHVDLRAMEQGYRLAQEAFLSDGKRILNASHRTQLEVFPKVNYNDLF